MQPILFYMIGYPGAGKTTLAGHLAGWFGGEYLRADQIGIKLFVVPTFTDAERKAVYQQMDFLAMTALNSGKSALYDGTLNSIAQRQHLRDLAASCKSVAVGIWLKVPPEIAKERASRLRDVRPDGTGGRIVPPDVFDQHAAAFESPQSGELYTEVDGLLPFSSQYVQLQGDLASLGLPAPKLIQL